MSFLVAVKVETTEIFEFPTNEQVHGFIRDLPEDTEYAVTLK